MRLIVVLALLSWSWLAGADSVSEVEAFTFSNCQRVQGKIRCKPSSPSGVISKQKTDLQAQVNATPSGGVLTLPAGRYTQGLVLTRPITLNLKGVNLTRVMWGKAPLVIEQREPGEIIINDFTHDGEDSQAIRRNLAGVRISGRQFNVTLNRAHIRGTSMGVLTDNKGGALQINDSLIEQIGGVEGYSSLSHLVYAGRIDSLSVVNTQLQGSLRKGHLLKSRAKHTIVKNSHLAGLDTRHSRVIDIPCGGRLEVVGSTLQASSKADNADMISMGVELPKNCGGHVRVGELVFLDNIVIFDSRYNPKHQLQNAIVFNWAVPYKSWRVQQNTLVAEGELLWQAPWQRADIGDIPRSNRYYRDRAAAGLTQ